MLVLWMNADDLSSGSRRLHLERPNWKDVEQAIRRLDGVRFTQVCLMKRDAVGMSITGGYDRRYMCEAISESGSRVLIDESRSRDNCVALVKGESPDYPEYWTSSFEVVLKAAKSYCETGEPDPSVRWKGIGTDADAQPPPARDHQPLQ